MPWPVGSRPNGKSPFGVYDMLGNVWEFVYDAYYPIYNKNNGAGKKNIEDEKFVTRVIRGGGWSSEAYDLTVTRRRNVSPDYAASNIGFRCAKTSPDS